MRQEDYEKLAEFAVDQLVANKTPLNQSIVKVAADNDLNPEQIKRVIEIANVKTFLKLFKDKPTRDANMEFDVASPDSVMKAYYKGGNSSCGGPADEDYSLESDAPDLMKTIRNPGSVCDFSAGVDSPTEKGEHPKIMILRLSKVASQLKDNIYDEEHRYMEGVEKLASVFKKDYGPDFSHFEKEAFHRYGEDVAFMLHDIRSVGNLKTPFIEHEKTAGVYVLDETPELDILDQMYEAKMKQVKCAAAIQVANSKIKNLTQCG